MNGNEVNLEDLSCKEAARLMSQRHDRTLSEPEIAALKEHLNVCLNCRRFDQQLDFMRRIAQRYAEGLPKKPASKT